MSIFVKSMVVLVHILWNLHFEVRATWYCSRRAKWHRFFYILGFLNELTESVTDLLPILLNKTLLPLEVVVKLLAIAYNPNWSEFAINLPWDYNESIMILLLGNMVLPLMMKNRLSLSLGRLNLGFLSTFHALNRLLVIRCLLKIVEVFLTSQFLNGRGSHNHAVLKILLLLVPSEVCLKSLINPLAVVIGSSIVEISTSKVSIKMRW